MKGVRMFAESPGRVPTLEPDDEGRLIAALPDWCRFLVRLAVATGCREGERLRATWRDVDFNGGILTIPDSKSGEPRRVPLHPAVTDELRSPRGLPAGFVVTLPDGRSPTRYRVADTFKRAARKIGRPDLCVHSLRHVALSRLLAAGASLREVMAMGGHRTVPMGLRYAHVNPVRLASLVAAMPAPGGTPATATAAGEAEHGW